MVDKNPHLKAVDSTSEPTHIAKPDDGFSLDKFKSQCAPTIGGVETLLTALPHHRIADAKDFVRLHPDDDYWSAELCFVSVPIKGANKEALHLIEETLAMRFLPSKKIMRFKLALATKPDDRFFLCHVPTQNLDNSWNDTNVQACEQARTRWCEATTRKDEGVESYMINYAKDQDRFPPPKWPSQSLEELIKATFHNRMITDENHPGLLRLLGAKQSVT
jgi:hypothetical protein